MAFINLSNHPFKSWSAEQLAAAASFGEGIIDFAFPNIPPAATLEDVQRLAKDVFNEMVKDEPCAVHVAGEMTFVFTFVSLCQAAGIPCVAATSERIVTENADGTKNVGFKFQQFRPYF